MLEDENELTGRQIVRFAFKNTEQPVTSWVEMFQKVIQILYAEDKTIITKLALSEDENIALHFNLNNETDWIQMANFHTKWIKKFFDVIIPYIKAS